MKADISDNSTGSAWPNSCYNRSRMRRALWNCAYIALFRFSPTPLHGWRRALLRLFGAKVGSGAHPYPKCRIWAPWNLTLGKNSCLADFVDCYCVAPIIVGAGSIVSQYSYLCAASHDYEDASFPTIAAPITVGAGCWIAADVFVGPGVSVGDGSVIGARSLVLRDVPPSTVWAGSPIRFLKQRNVRHVFNE